MTLRQVPSKADVDSYLRDRRNWGRWGDKGSAGAMNLITAEKRVSATALVKTGRTVSLSRPLAVTPTAENPLPAQHYMTREDRSPGGGCAMDFYGVFYHGTATTHIDALCHVWNHDGMWDGRSPDETLTFSGANYGTVDEWSDGILTRGVLLDVPKHRGRPYVTQDTPVHGWELQDIADAEGVRLDPGDAVMVYSGREAYAADNDGVWGGGSSRPGLHTSCLPFVRDCDMSILGWDMMDNSLLQPLAETCAEEGRYEFMLTINPLRVIGGTGSPVNPIAVF